MTHRRGRGCRRCSSLISLPAVVDYVTFMKVQRTAYLHIRFDWLFSIYVLFAVAAIVRYLWIGWRALVGGDTPPDETDASLRPMNLASPFSIAIVGDHGARAVRAADRLRHDRRLDPLSDDGRAGSRHRRRAAPERHVQSWILLAVPLFILAAEIMNSGTMTERLLRFCEALVGRFRGGLAQVNVVQSIIFAGMSGSAIADAAGSGRLMQNMMTREGKYTPSFAAALTAASSVIAPIIPPSIPLVLYALVSDASIGYLFIGGIVPGLLLASRRWLWSP